MNAGSAFGSSIRSSRSPSSRARSAASMSRSQRISRWSATNPIGQRTTSRTSHAASSLRCSRMSGPSHGSPGRRLALEGERPLVRPGALGNETRGLEQLVAVGIALVEDAGGQRMRGEDDVLVLVRREPLREQRRRTRAPGPSARRSGARRGRRAPARPAPGTSRSRATSSAARARARRSRSRRRRAPARPPRRSAASSGACR